MIETDNKKTSVRPRKRMGHGEQLARGFFGRRIGKTLNERQAAVMDDCLVRLKIDIERPAPSSLFDIFEANVSSVWMESGFGGGEHLVHRARENPNIGFIGVEPFRNGMAKALVSIEEAQLTNIRVYDEEAASLLDWLPANTLDGFYLLYPDPWPKTRHFKRRFVSPINLDRIARVLKPETEFRVATDIDAYVEWTLEHCEAHPSFTWLDGDEKNALEAWENWPGTRYEEKAIREKRLPRYLTFKRL
ncbi:MAG: tRNA (guanosine(46)-N7)-methyltransferase TrmB [Hyphomicrobiales bacterium]